MSDRVVADLLARIEELERADRSSPAGPRRRRSRRRHVGLAVAGLVALMLIPVGVFASHQFTDVPASNTFHSSISKVKLAGITAGCSPTQFCPSANVTRGQMAAFLARVAPRAESTFFYSTPLTEEETVLATFPIKAGEATGGTAAITVTATVNVLTEDASGCPCTAGFYVDSDRAPLGSFGQFATITETDIDFEGTMTGVATTSITVLIQIPTGVTENVYLIGWMQDGAAVDAYGEMVGTVALFDGLGNNVVIPEVTSQGASQGPAARRTR